MKQQPEMPDASIQPMLPGCEETWVVGCFFGYCHHMARSTDCEQAHAAMERHYRDQHAAEIACIVAGRYHIREARALARRQDRQNQKGGRPRATA